MGLYSALALTAMVGWATEPIKRRCEVSKWEYKFEVFDLEAKDNALEEAEKQLNGLGDQGWEVVSVLPKMGYEGKWGIALLKRPK